MPDKPWKRMERLVAKKLGGERVPVAMDIYAGCRMGDVTHERFFIEVKRQQRWRLLDWWTETAIRAKETGKIPIVVVGVPRQHGQWVFLSLDDFKEVVNGRDRSDQDEGQVRGDIWEEREGSGSGGEEVTDPASSGMAGDEHWGKGERQGNQDGR